jgi:hypothetical protein
VYYGLSREREHTPDEIGAMFGMTPAEARRAIRDITVKLLSGPDGFDVERALEALALGSKIDGELDEVPRISSVHLVVDPGDASPEDLAELYLALSDLYRAYGGRGLAFRSNSTEIGFIAGVLP